MLSVAQAIEQIISACQPLAAQTVALPAAHGRWLALPIVAARDLPGFDNSAMDGYAARSCDLPGTLPVAGLSAAGMRCADVPALQAGTAMQIFTGAPLPVGADTVVIVEESTRNGAHVVLPASPSQANIRRQGEDCQTGDQLVAAGTLVRAGTVALAAAQGHSQLTVHRRPRVAIIATGDELVAIDAPVAPGQLVDCSAHSLAAQIIAAGGEPTYLGIVPDDEAATAHAIKQALAYDVVLTTGGVSAGERDYVRVALAAAGVSLDFWKVAMKPGKPFAFGRAPSAAPCPTLVFALPGNPVSSFVGFELFVAPALRRLQGAPTTDAMPQWLPMQLVPGYQKPAGRAHILRCTVERGTSVDGSATLLATPLAKQGSAALSALAVASALVEIPGPAESIGPFGAVRGVLLG